MITIRTLSDTDSIQELLALSRQFFEEYQAHHHTFFTIDRLDREHVQDYFTRFTQDQDAAAFIAQDNKFPEAPLVGYLTVYIKRQADYWKVRQVGEISSLMVAEAYRRRGIASRLLTRARTFLSSKGIYYYAVYTAVVNQGALAFYHANGMEPLYTTLLGEIDPGE